MRVSVSRKGGVLGTEEVTELVDDRARVVDGQGAVTQERRLDESVREQLATLARRCSTSDAAAMEATKAVGADAVATTVEIEDGGEAAPVTINYASGDDVPAEVTELVGAVLEAPYRDPGTRWKKKQ